MSAEEERAAVVEFLRAASIAGYPQAARDALAWAKRAIESGAHLSALDQEARP